MLDAISRYVMDAAVTVKLPLGEVNIESAAAAAHSQQSGGRERDENKEKETPHHYPPQLSSSSAAIPRPYPAPVQVPPATDLVSAPGLISPSVHLHAVSAPVHIVDHRATVDDADDALSTTPPHRAVPPALTIPMPVERTESAHDREMRAAGRVTLPFVSDVAFLSSIHLRPRTTSDSELHKPPLHLQQSYVAEQHTIAVHPPDDTQQQHHAENDSERKSGGEHKKSTSVLSTFNKALLSITRTSSAVEGGRHTKNATSVHLPPASTLSGSKSDTGRVARLSKRRNSDSQTHYRGDTLSHIVTAPTASSPTATATAAASTIPVDLMRAPLLNRRISLSWFKSGRDAVRRGSVDLSSGSGSSSAKLSKSNVKGTFERVLVQRIVDDGSGLQADKKSSGGKEHKRSFMEQAMHSITHMPSAASSLTSSAAQPSTASASSLAAPSAEYSTSTSVSTSSAVSASSPPHPHPAAAAARLSANQLLLLARRRPPKESSLLHRLRDESSYTSKAVSKVIVSAPDHSSTTASSSTSSTHAATGALGGSSSGSSVAGGVADLACLVDGVEVVGVSVVSVSAQVSGRVKSLAVQLFSAPPSALS